MADVTFTSWVACVGTLAFRQGEMEWSDDVVFVTSSSCADGGHQGIEATGGEAWACRIRVEGEGGAGPLQSRGRVAVRGGRSHAAAEGRAENRRVEEVPAWEAGGPSLA